jgi:formylglycine-generating enzyme required for sulfatase activity
VSVDLWQRFEKFAGHDVTTWLTGLTIGLMSILLAAIPLWRTRRQQASLTTSTAPPVVDALVKLLQALFPGALWELANKLKGTTWGESLVQRLPPHDHTPPADWCHQLAELAQAEGSVLKLLDLLHQLRPDRASEIAAVARSSGLPTQAPAAAPKDEATRQRLRARYALRLNNLLKALPDVFQPGGQPVSVTDVYVELMLTDGPDALPVGPDALKGVTHRHMSKVGRGPTGERRTMQEVLDDPHRLWTLLGDPGSGKTTLLRHAALSLCQQPGRMPIYLTASELVEGLESALARLLGLKHLDLLDWLLDELHHGRAILLIDGLDEADPNRNPRGALRDLSERFGAENTIIVASRPINFQPIAPTFQHLALCPLDEAAQERLLTRWIGDEVSVNDALARLRQTRRLRRLVENPLLLTLAGLVLREGGALPTRRADLYDRALEALVRKRHTSEEARGLCLRSPERAMALLSGAALRLHGAEADVYPREALIGALRAEAAWWRWRPWGGPEAFVAEVAERTGLLLPDTGRLEGARAFQFPHRTFREHLAATALAAGLRRWGGLGRAERWRAWVSERGGVLTKAGSAALDLTQRRREAALVRVLGEAEARHERWAEVLALACGRLGPGGADALVGRITQEGNTALLLRVVADAEGLSVETVRGALSLERGWQEKQLQARHKVIEEIPALVKDLAVAVGLLEQVARNTTCGHDLFWVREVLRRIERGEVEGGVRDGSVEEAKRAAKGAADNVLGHLPKEKRAQLIALLKPWWRTIPTGSFDLGSNEYDNEKPIYRVTFTSDFQMLGVPVTWMMYRLFDPGHDAARSNFGGKLPPEAQDDVPVYNVSWFASMMFAEWVGARLPLEPEWEYACRAGTMTRFWSGDTDEDLARVGWIGPTSAGHPHPVAQKPKNPWGLHDVHGNVWEWCADPYDGEAYAARADGLSVDPRRLTFALCGKPPESAATGSTGAPRVVRGGSWFLGPLNVRSANRYRYMPFYSNGLLGFRLLLPSSDPPKPPRPPKSIPHPPRAI